eukprot:gene47645-63891_t
MIFGSDSDDEIEYKDNYDNPETIAEKLLSRPENAGMLSFHNGTEESLFIDVERAIGD